MQLNKNGSKFFVSIFYEWVKCALNVFLATSLYLEKHVLKITFTWKQRDFIKDNHKKVFCASRKNPAYKLTKLSQIKLNIETGTEKNLHPQI